MNNLNNKPNNIYKSLVDCNKSSNKIKISENIVTAVGNNSRHKFIFLNKNLKHF